MAKREDNETKTILKKLALYVVLYYLTYYLLSIIMVGAFDEDWDELGRFPFRIDKHEFNPGSGGPALGAWLAMVLTYVVSLGLCFWVIRATRKSWDYVLTVGLLHFVLCCLVNVDFPTNWIWWVTLIIGAVLVAVVAEVAIYWLRDMREIVLDH